MKPDNKAACLELEKKSGGTDMEIEGKIRTASYGLISLHLSIIMSLVFAD